MEKLKYGKTVITNGMAKTVTETTQAQAQSQAYSSLAKSASSLLEKLSSLKDSITKKLFNLVKQAKTLHELIIQSLLNVGEVECSYIDEEVTLYHVEVIHPLKAKSITKDSVILIKEMHVKVRRVTFYYNPQYDNLFVTVYIPDYYAREKPFKDFIVKRKLVENEDEVPIHIADYVLNLPTLMTFFLKALENVIIRKLEETKKILDNVETFFNTVQTEITSGRIGVLKSLLEAQSQKQEGQGKNGQNGA